LKGKYRIPSEEDVRSAVEKVMKYRGEVHSLREMLEYVRRELGGAYALSGKRLLKIASSLGIRIKVHRRKSNTEIKICPICGGELTTADVMTLKGEIAKSGRICKNCGFRTDRARFSPARYSFYKVKF